MNIATFPLHAGIPNFLDRKPLIWSYSLLNTYRSVCPHQMFRRYIVKDLPFVKSPEMKWGNDVHSAFEHRIGSNIPLPNSMRQWEHFASPFAHKGAMVELKLGVTADGQPTGFFDKNVKGRGKADLVLIRNTTAYMLDWKTGGSKYEDPFELEVCALLLKVKFPTLQTIKGQYAWLKENRVGTLYDLSNTELTWSEVNALLRKIEEDRAAGEFSKRQSGLCGFCAVPDCEYRR